MKMLVSWQKELHPFNAKHTAFEILSHYITQLFFFEEFNLLMLMLLCVTQCKM